MSNELPTIPANAADASNRIGHAWAVSTVMVKTGPVINVMNDLQLVRAASEDEAVGHAVRVSIETHPGHMLHCVTRIRLHSKCDDSCFYHCTENGAHTPDCLLKTTPGDDAIMT